MRNLVIILVLTIILISCYKPYIGDLENRDKILVVDGLVTNQISRYHVVLNYTSPFYSLKKQVPVSSAKVTVFDNKGNKYEFMEIKPGEYVSDSTEFTAVSGNTYYLSIYTPDGETYYSSPQKIVTEFHPDSVYAINGYTEYISRFNEILQKISGANIMVDINDLSKTPYFRFDSKLIYCYTYSKNIPPPIFDPPLYLFYCWQSENFDKKLNLYEKSYNSSQSLNKQFIYFINEVTYLEGIMYDLGSPLPDLSYKGIPSTKREIYNIANRILYLDLYSLNRDTYSYYKNINELLTSEGKLFDPISVQIESNIKCTSNQNIKVLGFFEASSLNRTAYLIGSRNPVSNQVIIKEIPAIYPQTPDGCSVNKTPPFWLF